MTPPARPEPPDRVRAPLPRRTFLAGAFGGGSPTREPGVASTVPADGADGEREDG